MKFTRIYIDGYGIFHDFDLQGISPGATVLLGRNESGKSTLLSFIRTVLFGFQDRRSSDNPYDPLAGGRHGGRLTLVDDQGEEFIIERYAGPKGGQVQVTLPDGSAGTADDVPKLLGHTSRDLYRNVFAFSLSELQEFETLSNEDVRTRIYGAGIGSGRLGLSEIERRLEQERAELYVERGSKQEIAKLIHEANELDGELRTLSQQAGDYRRLRSELANLERRSKAMDEDRRMTRSKRDHVTNLLRAWNAWSDLNSALRNLDELIDVQDFPPNGVNRFERLLERRADAGGELNELERDLADKTNEAGQLEVNEDVLRERSQIAGLERGLDMYDAARSDLPMRRSELKSAQQELTDGLRGIGPDWTEELVRGFDTSLPTTKVVRQFGGRLEAAAEQQRDAERDAAGEKRTRDQLEGERRRLEDARSSMAEPPERDRGLLAERRRATKELRTASSGQALRVQEKEHLGERRDDLQEQRRWMEGQTAAGDIRLPIWPSAVLILAALVGGLVIGILANVIAAVSISSGLAILALIYAGVRRWAPSPTAARVPQEDREAAQRRIDEVEVKASAIQAEIEIAELSISDLATAVGLDRSVTAKDLEAVESRIEGDLETLNAWNVAEERIKEATRKLDESEKHLRTLSEAVQTARGQHQQVAAEWRAWLEGRGLDSTLSPETCLEVLSRAEGLREKTKAIDELQRRINEMTTSMEGFRGRTNAVRRLVGMSEEPDGSFPAAVDELAKIANEERTKSDRRDELRNQINEDKGKQDSLKDRLESMGPDIEALLTEGGAKDEDEYRRRAEIYEQRKSLQTDISQGTREIERLFGSDRLEQILSELGDTDPEQLTAHQGALDDRLQELDRDLESASQQQGQVTQQVSQIEGDEESSDLRLRRAVIHEQANSHARRWSVLAIAEALLTETRLKYERERQPAVIQEAQRFFANITGGSYQRILSLPGEQAIAVEDGSGNRKDTTQLSRGTAEQLYLSLRFGFVREFAARAMPLPVIMDDILVNFDPERAAAACKALLELSADQQVLLFTCHPTTVELMRSAGPDCSVVELTP